MSKEQFCIGVVEGLSWKIGLLLQKTEPEEPPASLQHAGIADHSLKNRQQAYNMQG